jgi:hypothetical protein
MLLVGDAICNVPVSPRALTIRISQQGDERRKPHVPHGLLLLSSEQPDRMSLLLTALKKSIDSHQSDGQQSMTLIALARKFVFLLSSPSRRSCKEMRLA